MEFKKPMPSDYKFYKKWLYTCENSCEYSYLNACMWQYVWQYEYAIYNDALVIRLDVDGKKIYNIPLGNIEETVMKIEEFDSDAAFSSGEGEALAEFLSKFGEKYNLTLMEENNEYIYKREDLANLSGKKYHQKRNHISAFTRKYNWRFEKLVENNISDALTVSNKWLLEREDEDGELLEEYNAIEYALNNLSELEILGGILYVEDTPVAFTFGSALNEQVFDVNIEKALADYQGAYAVINNQFVINCLKNFEFINREDDLGISGLRQAKLSYRPHTVLKKYVITKK